MMVAYVYKGINFWVFAVTLIGPYHNVWPEAIFAICCVYVNNIVYKQILICSCVICPAPLSIVAFVVV